MKPLRNRGSFNHSDREHQGASPRRPAEARRARAGVRPRLEGLEDRRLLATLAWEGDLAFNTGLDGFLDSASGDTNWVGDVLPASGDTLVFPGTTSSFFATNDSTAGTNYVLEFTGAGFQISGNAISISGTGVSDSSTSSNFNVLATPLILSGPSTISVADTSHSLFLLGDLSGSQTLAKTGAGLLSIGAASTYGGPTTISGGTLDIAAPIVSDVILDGGRLAGDASVGAVSSSTGGTVAPGVSPGILGTGSLSFDTATTFEVEIDGTSPGVGGHDQLAVTGSVSLGDAVLDIQLGFSPADSDAFVIIDNDGTDTVSGSFAGLSEGSIFSAGGSDFAISYQGGDGNDVVVTATNSSAPGAPTASSDHYVTPENTTLFVSSFDGVLADDTDPEGDPLQAVLSSGPSHGSLSLNGDGSVTYIPAANCAGSDSFL